MTNTTDDFDWSTMGPTERDYALAKQMFAKGIDVAQIRHALVETHGLKPDFADRVVFEQAVESIHIVVVGGIEIESIDQRLRERGFTPDEVVAIRGHAFEKFRPPDRSPRVLVLGLGFAIVLGGLGLSIGSFVGMLPIPVSIGLIIMTIGGIFVRFASKSN